MAFSSLGLVAGLGFGRQQGVVDPAALNRLGILGAFLGFTPTGIVGTQVLARREGEAITPPTVPTGAGQVQVPSVTGLPVAAAEAILQAIGLRTQRSSTDSTTTPIDEVVSQDPAPSSSVPTGAQVTLRVSQGFLLPTVTGVQRDVAEQLLQALNLTVTIVVDQSVSSQPPNTVIKQDPQASTRVSPSSTVTLTVSPPPMVDIQLLTGVNNIAPTVSEPVAGYAGRITPPGALQAIWEIVPGTNTFLAFAPGAPAIANNLAQVTRLRPVIIIASAPATLRQPEA